MRTVAGLRLTVVLLTCTEVADHGGRVGETMIERKRSAENTHTLRASRVKFNPEDGRAG